MPSDRTDNPVYALLAGKEEDRFTGFLARILREEDLAFHFLREVCRLDPKSDRAEVRTQLVVPDGRPDLTISGPGLLVIIEAKMASWLHETQLEPYAAFIEELRKSTPTITTRLLLLGPAASREAMEAEGRRQVGAALSSVCTWEEIAAFSLTQAARHRGKRVGFYLEDFADLISHRLGELPRALTREETDLLADPLAAQAIGAANKALAELFVVLGKRADLGISLSDSSGHGYDGYSIKTQQRWWWVGVWPVAWPSVGRSPLMLQLAGINEHAEPPRLEGAAKPVPFFTPQQRGWVVPLEFKPDVEPAQLAAEHARVVAAWISQAPTTGRRS